MKKRNKEEVLSGQRCCKLKVSEIVVLKSTQKGLPAPDSDASYNCGEKSFSAGLLLP
jgi:hypothetical protein